MSATPVTSKMKRVHPGTVLLSEPAAQGNPSQFKQIFRCRKNGYEFLGQVRIDVSRSFVGIEVFNEGYFDLFEVEPLKVRAVLQERVLTQLLRQKPLSETHTALIRACLEENRQLLFETSEPEPVAREEKDLEFLRDQLNREYFQGRLEVAIEWGKNVKTPNRRSIKFGSFDPGKNLIRIHPRLKQSFVPLSVLELTVYHEMCHKFLPPVKRNGQWMSHHRDFKRKEREYRNFREALQWEKRHWAKLLLPAEGETDA